MCVHDDHHHQSFFFFVGFYGFHVCVCVFVWFETIFFFSIRWLIYIVAPPSRISFFLSDKWMNLELIQDRKFIYIQMIIIVWPELHRSMIMVMMNRISEKNFLQLGRFSLDWKCDNKQNWMNEWKEFFFSLTCHQSLQTLSSST